MVGATDWFDCVLFLISCILDQHKKYLVIIYNAISNFAHAICQNQSADVLCYGLDLATLSDKKFCCWVIQVSNYTAINKDF